MDSKRGGPREGKETWKLFPLVQGPEIFVVGAAFRGSIIRDLLGLPQLVSCRTGPEAPPLGKETEKSKTALKKDQAPSTYTCKKQQSATTATQGDKGQ
jgi:hypothetical protein